MVSVDESRGGGEPQVADPWSSDTRSRLNNVSTRHWLRLQRLASVLVFCSSHEILLILTYC